MADDTTTTETAAKPAKIHRLRIGLNVIVQIALLFFLVVMVNYLAFEHYRRWDLSRDQKYALSDKTKRFLETIKGKVRTTVFFAPNNPIGGDVSALLTEYQYAAKGKMDVEIIDPNRNFSRAKEIVDKYKVVSDESFIVLEYDGRNKTVKASEMAEIEQGNPMFGEQPKIGAFKGEQAITSALMDLVEGKKNILGYVLGHKEPPLAEGGLISVLKMVIEGENIKFQELNLFEVPAIPAEMQTVMIDGPQYDFSDREMKLLRDFWDKQGRILLLLDPAAKTPKLLAFLNELGVKVNDDRLMAVIRTGIEELAIIQDVQAQFLPDSPITKRLAEARSIFPGGSSSLTLEPDRVKTLNLRLQPLVQAEKGYWAEKDYRSGDQAKYQADATSNPGTPLMIAASIERGGSGDDRVQVNSARMVVVSNALFIQDAALKQGQQAPLDFVSASVNWLLNREQLIGIAPKVPRVLTFSIDEGPMRNLRWLILLFLPLVPAVLGFAVWWQRRS